MRHGLSLARRSATRLFTRPFHDWAGPVDVRSVRQRSWDFLVPFAVFPGRGSPHFCGSSPRVVSRAVARSRVKPADFYGRPVAHLLAPSRLGRVFQNATDACERRDADRLLGFATAAKPSEKTRAMRVVWADRFQSIRAERVGCAHSPILPWAFRVFSRACRMPFQRHVCAPARSSARADRNSPQPYLSWAAIRSWVFRRLMQWTCARAHSVQSSHWVIEQQRRHPCRRRPFSVFGRFAPSHSERSRSSHSRLWGRASVSERLPV